MSTACWLEPLRIDRCRGDLEREAGSKPGGAGDVERLLANLAHTTADNLPDLRRVHARSVEQCLEWHSKKVGRMHRGQCPVATTNRSTDGINNHDFTHGWILGPGAQS